MYNTLIILLRILTLNQTLPIDDFLAQKFSTIIDVRSPKEYEHSHIPNAINFPVLNDEEFQQIGTLYKKDSFNAKILGASFVCKNISHHLLNLKHQITPARPFGIYCARGGMRSNSFGIVLKNIGYRAVVLKGGYKSYRTEVTQTLQDKPNHNFITLIGPTGSGKSEIIHAFDDSLDIEGIARHLGSSFGRIYGMQPSVKMFQNLLFERLKSLTNSPFVLVEGESKKLGNLILPSPLYQAYHNAPKILILSPLEQRIQRIVAQYGKISQDFFKNSMQKIAPFMKKQFWQEAQEAFLRRDLQKVAEILLVEYYDKVYKKESFKSVIYYQNATQVIEEIKAFAKEFYKIKE